MTQNYRFTIAQDEDLQAILIIFENRIRQQYETPDDEIRQCVENLRESFINRGNNSYFWVARELDNPQIIGWQSYLPIFQTALKKNTALETSIYLDAEHHKNGAAFELFTYTLSIIEKEKYQYIYGFINSDNLRAVKFFIKLGFSQSGTIPPSPHVFPYFYEKLMFIYKF